MNDLDLDARIRDAAPHLASVAGLAGHGARILREARARRVRRLRVWGASAAASVVLVGGSSVAMAGGGNETPWGWVADNVFSIERTEGSACFQGLLVKWNGLAEDDPIVVDAKAIVSGIDLESLDTTAKEAELTAEYADSRNVEGEPAPIVVSADQLKQDAVFQMVGDELWDRLDERGHEMWPGHEVSLSAQGTDCR
ncbi:hypothetical protein [Microbacterium sp. UFMG61]|uniref:hypothetical protein n=1 Tax=Microbacterium sp. UFMG61 TaxID=2745935 RepID=UPI00188E368D|nr:hypothetical protein [Microbacterium sp. UFMG61]